MKQFNLAACVITALLIGAAELHARALEAQVMNVSLPPGHSIVSVEIPAWSLGSHIPSRTREAVVPALISTEELAIARTHLATRDS